ncbi:MAG TPA: ribose-5-phosphate isomerase RpiA [Thermoplasmatales archaeon]|nr:ribose-5-phosphate isomerase RpiA [Thermoplasmatales archaeon]
MDINDMKRLAAEKAVEYVEDGMVVGLGTGSTVEYLIPKLGKLVKEGLDIIGIPTSHRTKNLAEEHHIPLSTLTEHPKIDLTIDGADEVDPSLNLIKGGGGALTKEKIVAFSSKTEIIIVDETKLVQQLGISFPLPVEVIPFGWYPTKLAIEENLSCTAELRKENDNPYTTDNMNYLLDCEFTKIDDPKEVEMKINTIPGVVETGLFIGLADIVIVGTREGIKTLER